MQEEACSFNTKPHVGTFMVAILNQVWGKHNTFRGHLMREHSHIVGVHKMMGRGALPDHLLLHQLIHLLEGGCHSQVQGGFGTVVHAGDAG